MGVGGKVSRRAVFLDRDGVLNRAIVRDGKPYPPASPEELKILPDVPKALERLKGLGYLLIVVTNQPDVARGNLRASDVEGIHVRMGQCCRSTISAPVSTITVMDAIVASRGPG